MSSDNECEDQIVVTLVEGNEEYHKEEKTCGYNEGFRATEDTICEMFLDEETGKVPLKKFLNAITATGIRTTDPRLHESMHDLKRLLKQYGTTFESADTLMLEEFEFKQMIRMNVVFINRILRTNFVISDWLDFCSQIYILYEMCKHNRVGKVSNFIPQLADYSPGLWGVAVCSVDGQRFSAGDTNVAFCMQACCRVLNYAIVLNDHGAENVHKCIGQEPSGRNVKDLVLNENQKPHNPLINAGAIVVTSMLKNKHRHMATRYDSIYNLYRKMAGKEYLGFSNACYLSERQISYRNFALGYLLREKQCLPDGEKLTETMELLLQLYSVEVTCESLSVMAATLANGGVCPITGEFIIGSNYVRDVLSLMYSCGMNDYSGKFAFYVGLPARSSISGAIMLIVPNVMGVCLWSPPLDVHENSVRGMQFCAEFAKIFHLHNYDNAKVGDKKIDPHRVETEMKTQQISLTLFAAANGDLVALRKYFLEHVDLSAADFEGRTPLHVAAAEGHLECVRFLLEVVEVPAQPYDKWNAIPLDDARNYGHTEVAEFLENWAHDNYIEIETLFSEYDRSEG